MAARLIYSAIASLDGYVEDATGAFGWAEPDEDVFAFVDDLERPVGTYLYGRRMYETMAVWETLDVGGRSPAAAEFARIWRAADKVVYSRTLTAVSTRGTRLERDFEPVAVRELKEAADRDLTVGGAELAAAALRAGLVEELQLLLAPVVVGGGKPALPADVRLELELADERRFASGFVHLRYRIR